MKMKGKSRTRLGRLASFMTVSILVVGLVVAVPSAVGTVYAAPTLDLEGEKTLRVKVEEMTMEGAGEEAKAEMPQVAIDLYKVADAEKVDGYDAYSFVSLFDGLDFNIEDGRESDYKEVWNSLAQEAARIVFDSDAEPEVVDGKPNEDITLDSGLYLMIVRGKDMAKEEYIVREKESAEDGNISTIAYSDTYTFTYSPQLVALPAKEDVNGIIATSNPGDWLDSLTLEPKVTMSERLASLRIDKELMSYHTGSPATFVYTVEATLRGRTVYSNVVSLTFDGPGSKSELIVDRIPVGAQVTVTEVYSGVTYRAVAGSQTVQTLVLDGIRPEEEGFDNIVSFRNEYDETGRKGSAITNHFEYSDDVDGHGEWVWTQIPAAE